MAFLLKVLLVGAKNGHDVVFLGICPFFAITLTPGWIRSHDPHAPPSGDDTTSPGQSVVLCFDKYFGRLSIQKLYIGLATEVAFFMS
jgi:hypothetical protein